MKKQDLYDSHLLCMGMLIALGGDKLNEKFEEYMKDIKKLIMEMKE